MSFARPEVSSGFKTLQSFFLWFQMAYSMWQFVRTAKFLRLPYVLFSSLWHGCDSWIMRREVIMMRDDMDVDQHALTMTSAQVPSKGIKIVDVGDHNAVEVSFSDSNYTCLTDRHRAEHMKMLQEYEALAQFGRDDDVLLPDVHLIRRLSFDDAMDHVLAGKGYEISSTGCFFDWSSKDFVNQNFVRFASIWPLILQARRYDFWSVILSVLVILMDVFSYWANKLWRSVQFLTSRFVKWSISRVSSRERRKFLFTFMATISSRFYCRNFVTGEASFKLVKQVLLATHNRLEKGNSYTLRPLQCTVVVPRTHRTQGSSQKISYLIDDVSYDAIVTPALDEVEPSSVHFRGAKFEGGIKVVDWRVAEMAYFLEVCDFFNQFKCPPIKILCGNDAVCCSFAEIVHGVKTRSFVVCEFKTAQRLYVT